MTFVAIDALRVNDQPNSDYLLVWKQELLTLSGAPYGSHILNLMSTAS